MLAPRAVGVDGAGDEFLAGAALAGDEHAASVGATSAIRLNTVCIAGLRPMIASGDGRSSSCGERLAARAAGSSRRVIARFAASRAWARSNGLAR